ncbi:hypothetical protein HY480_01610 [Candidatus Uhrbacteria bacterium]|nr:hypothetical protein [Candidatus Uhrbacteria bacterium]
MKIIIAIFFRSTCPSGHTHEELVLEGKLFELVHLRFPGFSPKIVVCPTCGGKLGGWLLVTRVNRVEMEALPPAEFIAKYDELGRRPGPEDS